MARLEVHEHTIISGPRAAGVITKIRHSHAGGDRAHQHDHTGPATYTIDKDDWFRATGLRGGGRKRFTAAPFGEQLPIRDLEAWQRSFDVIVLGPPATDATGPGIAPAARMALAFGMRAEVR